MDLSLDFASIVQGAIAVAIVWHGKAVRELVTAVKLLDWRVTQLESEKKV